MRQRLFLAYAKGDAGLVEPYRLRRIVYRQVDDRGLIVISLRGDPDRSRRHAGYISVSVYGGNIGI